MGRVIIQFGRSRLILSLIVAAGLVLGYMGYSQQDDPIALLMATEPVTNSGEWDSFETFKIDFSILDDERYKSLQVYGENPVIFGTLGERVNIFAPGER